MTAFVLRRLLQGVVTLWVVASLTFVLVRLTPGGPFDGAKPLPDAVRAHLGRSFGLAEGVPSPVAGTLDHFQVHVGQSVSQGTVLARLRLSDGSESLVRAPRDLTIVQLVGQPGRVLRAGDVLLVRETSWLQQYLTTLTSWASGDLGVTYASEGSRTVVEQLGDAAPVSLELALLALGLALLVGVPLGAWTALRPRSWLDHVTTAAALAVVSMSTLVLAPVLLVVFGVWLQWLPWGGWEPFAFSWEHLQPKILPVVTLALVYAAWFARLTRAGLLDVLGEPWVRAARARGLTERQVVMRHALRGALVPVVAFLGPAVAGLAAGSVVVERVFAVPGMGDVFVTAALNRDLPLVLGAVLLYAAGLILANLAVDVACAALDPRLRRAP